MDVALHAYVLNALNDGQLFIKQVNERKEHEMEKHIENERRMRDDKRMYDDE